MSKVSEKAIYKNYEPIPLNGKVSIIPKDFTEVMNKNGNWGLYSTDNNKFLNGILISKEVISLEGYGGTQKFGVRLNDQNKTEIEFKEGEYYFKIVPPPFFSRQFFLRPFFLRGGKKSHRKRNSKKSKKNRKNRRKSNKTR